MTDTTYWPDGTVNERFYLVDRTYTRYDEAGELVEKRPMTNPEWATWGVEIINRLDLETRVAAQVPDLLVMITDLQARLDIPKADLTNTELRRTIRDVRQLARAVIQLARLVGNVLDSTDSGTP